MQNLTETFTNYAINYGVKILGALAIFFVGKWVANFLTKFIRKIIVPNSNIIGNNITKTIKGAGELFLFFLEICRIAFRRLPDI